MIHGAGLGQLGVSSARFHRRHGCTARWRAASGGHEPKDQMARLLLALATEGSEGEGVEQAMDAGIHQIDRFDFGFNGLEMNSSSVSNVLDEMLH